MTGLSVGTGGLQRARAAFPHPFARPPRWDWQTVFEVPPMRAEQLRIRECDSRRLRLAKTMASFLEQQFGSEKASRAYVYATNLEKHEIVANRLEARTALAEAELAEIKKRHKLQRADKRLREDALAAARENRTPNVDGLDDLDTVSIADPSESETLVRVGKGPPMRITDPKPKQRLRVVSLRDDPVGLMAKRGQLGNDQDRELRLHAARAWRTLYEASQIGNLRAVDPNFEPVDGGAVGSDISAMQLDAFKRLGELSRVLGRRNTYLVRRILGENMTLKQFAAAEGAPGGSKASREKAVGIYGQRLCDSLDDLAREFRLSAKGAGPQRSRDRFDDTARYSHSAALHEAVERAKPRP